jgi:hypothetical protein
MVFCKSRRPNIVPLSSSVRKDWWNRVATCLLGCEDNCCPLLLHKVVRRVTNVTQFPSTCVPHSRDHRLSCASKHFSAHDPPPELLSISRFRAKEWAAAGDALGLKFGA